MDERERNVERIRGSYSAFLQPLVGLGELHDRLINGLEQVLEAPEIDEVPEIRGNGLLDREIDYDALSEKLSLGKRVNLKKALQMHKKYFGESHGEPITTYGQLLDTLNVSSQGRVHINLFAVTREAGKALVTSLDEKGIEYVDRARANTIRDRGQRYSPI